MNATIIAGFLRDIDRQIREGTSLDEVQTQLLQWAEKLEQDEQGPPDESRHPVAVQQREGHL